jgi:hypothetical protein
MLKSATREWSEIVLRCQVPHTATLEKTLFFSLFSLARRGEWILIRHKFVIFFGLNKQQQQKPRE